MQPNANVCYFFITIVILTIRYWKTPWYRIFKKMLKPFETLMRRFQTFLNAVTWIPKGSVLFQVKFKIIIFYNYTLIIWHKLKLKIGLKIPSNPEFPFCVERRSEVEIWIKTLHSIIHCNLHYILFRENHLSAVHNRAIYIYMCVHVYVYALTQTSVNWTCLNLGQTGLIKVLVPSVGQ